MTEANPFGSVSTYNEVEHWCRSLVHSGFDTLHDKVEFQRSVHKTAQDFDFPVSGSTMLALAKEANFSPFLLARYLVESLLSIKKKELAEAMREPESILATYTSSADNESQVSAKHSMGRIGPTVDVHRLAREVRVAIDSDPLYGPLHDKERHIVGVEYEAVLEQSLVDMGIPFESESELRYRGTARTPDVLLKCPVGVLVQKKNGDGCEWKRICWIDSKATFGDASTHNTTVLLQAESYLHRFGPGLILYWFGHAPHCLLGNAQGDIVIAASELPIRFMWPNGDQLIRKH